MYSKIFAILTLLVYAHSLPQEYRPKAIPNKWARLPTTVIPSNYNLQLTLTKDDLETNNKFSGIVVITVQAADDITDFKLNGKFLENIKVTAQIPGEITEVPGLSTLDSSNGVLDISLQKPLPKGKDVLIKIQYTGKLSDTSMRGFYKSTYLDGDVTKHVATTHFESMSAREAFPCFDEPALKATFDITINHPDGYTALSNSAKKDGSTATSTTFETTPAMSTYLVAFIVSPFECVGDEKTYNYCGPTKNNLDYIQSVVPTSLAAMKSVTAKSYEELGQSHLTQAAIPDFAAGAMENWGLITYREAAVYFNTNKSTLSDKQRILTTVTHELAHLWFGDYMTLDWWNNIFLNEGFATYFEYFAADKDNEKMELPKQFVIDQLQPALLSDSLEDTHALSVEDNDGNNDPSKISSYFDNIAYNKGGTVLRMIRHILETKDNFNSAMTEYIKQRDADPQKMATVAKLYAAIQTVVEDKKISLPNGKTVQEVLDSWITGPGYPVLNVELADNVTISQTRFTLSENKDTTKWYIPITYTTPKGNFQQTKPTTWLTPNDNSIVVPVNKDEWIILNNQQTGFYRVSYDEKLLGLISNELKNNIINIDEISRSQLVDDQFNFAVKMGKYTAWLKFVEFLNNEESYYTWSSAFRSYNTLIQSLNNPKLKQALTNLIIQRMESALNEYPIDKVITEHMDVLAHVLINTWACKLNENKCQNYVADKFALMLTDETIVPVDLRSLVYCNGLRTNTGLFNNVTEKYATSQLASEKLMLLKALGCVNDETLLTQYLESSLTGNVRIQDASYIYDSVLSNHVDGVGANTIDGVKVVLNFINTNSTNFVAKFGDLYELSALISKVGNLITNDAQLALLNKITSDDNTITEVLKKAVSKATDNIKTVQITEQELTTFFDGDNSSAYSNQISFSLIFAFVVYLILN